MAPVGEGNDKTIELSNPTGVVTGAKKSIFSFDDAEKIKPTPVDKTPGGSKKYITPGGSPFGNTKFDIFAKKKGGASTTPGGTPEPPLKEPTNCKEKVIYFFKKNWRKFKKGD